MTDPAAPAPDPAEHDLELTVSALKDGPAALGIPGALVEIRRWQERIDGTDAPALEEIGAALAELRELGHLLGTGAAESDRRSLRDGSAERHGGQCSAGVARRAGVIRRARAGRAWR